MSLANSIENVVFHRVHSSDFELPERADVILHEQIGEALFDERVVENVAELRDRILKPGGRIFPAHLRLFIEPVEVHADTRAPFHVGTGAARHRLADQAAKSSYTKTLQQALADAGYYDAKVDGVYGPKTVTAVEALQKANGLPQTGTLDKATEKALRSELAAKGGAAAQEETASTAAVQQTLTLAGYWDGPVDGVWTDELTKALEELQGDLGVKVTGTVDAATIAAVEKAIADLGAQPSPTASTSASPEPTASS